VTNQELITLAKEAREFSHSPISKFKVGAALLTSDGKVFTGCNIEDSSGVGLTNICAERCAIMKAISEGYNDFVSIAVVGGKDELINCLPCGICRQYLNSFAPHIKIISLDNDGLKEHSLEDLLPYRFNENFDGEL